MSISNFEAVRTETETVVTYFWKEGDAEYFTMSPVPMPPEGFVTLVVPGYEGDQMFSASAERFYAVPQDRADIGEKLPAGFLWLPIGPMGNLRLPSGSLEREDGGNWIPASPSACVPMTPVGYEVVIINLTDHHPCSDDYFLAIPEGKVVILKRGMEWARPGKLATGYEIGCLDWAAEFPEGTLSWDSRDQKWELWIGGEADEEGLD